MHGDDSQKLGALIKTTSYRTLGRWAHDTVTESEKPELNKEMIREQKKISKTTTTSTNSAKFDVF